MCASKSADFVASARSSENASDFEIIT